MDSMTLSSQEAPNLKLSPPVSEQLPAMPKKGKEADPQAPEKAISAPEKSAATAPPIAMPAIPLPTLPVTPTTTSKSDVKPTAKSTTPTLLNDTDLIEKEWVDKAKQIVERTRDDPHQQSEELTGLKADYMKTHYDKTIKLNK